MEHGIPVSASSIEAYGRYLAGREVYPSVNLLVESFYFHDTDYTRKMCLAQLTLYQVAKLPLLVVAFYVDCQKLEVQLYFVDVLSDLQCKAFIVLVRPYPIRILEYIEEINSDDSVMTSTSTVASESESSLNGGTYREAFCQYLVDKLCTTKIRPERSTCRRIMKIAPNLHFKDQELAQHFIHCGLKSISMSGLALNKLFLLPSEHICQLDLSNNSLHDSEMRQLCLFIEMCPLIRLKIDHNCFTAESAPALAQAFSNGLSGSCMRLREVSVSANNFGSGIVEIVSALCAARFMAFLDISFNNLRDENINVPIRDLLTYSVSLRTFRCFDEGLSSRLTEELKAEFPRLDIYMKEEIPIESVDYCFENVENDDYHRARERYLLLSNDSVRADVYYLISDTWLEYWRSYIAGGKRPREIDNRDSGYLFRAVNREVWRILFQLYGGGPEIQRTWAYLMY